MLLSVDEILQLAPDESSAKAAKGLVAPAKWPRLGNSAAAMWGECQGSGAKPYLVQVDKSGPAFRCSCPSRKFPCKHGLALLLLWARDATAFTDTEPPEWVTSWLATRQQRSVQQEQKRAAVRQAPADPQAAAKREATRSARMQGGLDELQRWLSDHVRQGLATLPGKTDLWPAMAARMVDAQLPGLAFRLRQISTIVGRGEGWPERLLGQLGALQILIDAARHIDSLPAPVAADVRIALGLATEKETLLADAEKVADDWQVLGQSLAEEERLWVRRVWLLGQQSGRQALLLDYAHGTARFEHGFVTGSVVRMTLIFYPSAAPLRAVVAEGPVRQATTHLCGAPESTRALRTMAHALAANPWQWPQGLWLGDAVPGQAADGWQLHTGAGSIPLRTTTEAAWQLIAHSGGAPLAVFGEWDGGALHPLAYSVDGQPAYDLGAST